MISQYLLIAISTSLFNHQIFALSSRYSYRTDIDGTAPPEITVAGGECIENRIEALEIGRQCSRRCKKDAPCENARKQCLCDGLCGMSCIKPDLNCAELKKIENGDFFPKSNRFNTKVMYQCDTGYYLFGSRERLCQGDEDWSGTPAECLSEREYLTFFNSFINILQ